MLEFSRRAREFLRDMTLRRGLFADSAWGCVILLLARDFVNAWNGEGGICLVGWHVNSTIARLGCLIEFCGCDADRKIVAQQV